jgi:stalled ribosome alternative rescue factor ArfA
MKRKVIIIDNLSEKGRKTPGGIVVEKEVTIRNLAHLEAQQTYRAQVFKPKKGKGSFKRNKKHTNKLEY